METLVQRIFRYFLGDRDSFPIERQVLNALVLASSLLATLLVVEAIVFDYQKAFVLSFAAASIFWGIYLFGKKAKKSDSPLWIYLLVSGFVVLADRFFVGGNAGLALLILVTISGSIPLITRKEQLKTAVFLLLLFFVVICALTANYWHTMPVQLPSRVSLLVQVLESGILMTCLFSVAYLAISSYRHEKRQVSSLSDELVKQERLATLGRLTTTVSHELRNPLGTIQNSLFSLQLTLDAGEQQLTRKLLNICERNVVRCDRIIDELLTYGQKRTLEEIPVSVDELIDETLNEMGWPEGIELRKELGCNDAYITGDKEKLRRVILNLAVNAQQALKESIQENKLVSVTTRKVDDQVEILIEDNGPGIPEDLKEKIFEPLFSTKNFGVGLGMTIVKDIINMHKGSVRLQAEDKEGCCFVIQLPLRKN